MDRSRVQDHHVPGRSSAVALPRAQGRQLHPEIQPGGLDDRTQAPPGAGERGKGTGRRSTSNGMAHERTRLEQDERREGQQAESDDGDEAVVQEEAGDGNTSGERQR